LSLVDSIAASGEDPDAHHKRKKQRGQSFESVHLFTSDIFSYYSAVLSVMVRVPSSSLRLFTQLVVEKFVPAASFACSIIDCMRLFPAPPELSSSNASAKASPSSNL